MANPDWAYGLLAVESLTGDSPRIERMPLRQTVQSATAYTTALYKGQILGWDYNTTAGGGYLIVVSNTTVANVVGVAAEYYAGSASTQTDLAVWPASENIFEVQADNTTTTSNGKLKILQNAAIVGMTAGNTNSGISGMELDWSSIATTTDKPLTILKTIAKPGTSSTGSNVQFQVRFNFGRGYEQQATVI